MNNKFVFKITKPNSVYVHCVYAKLRPTTFKGVSIAAEVNVTVIRGGRKNGKADRSKTRRQKQISREGYCREQERNRTANEGKGVPSQIRLM